MSALTYSVHLSRSVTHTNIPFFTVLFGCVVGKLDVRISCK